MSGPLQESSRITETVSFTTFYKLKGRKETWIGLRQFDKDDIWTYDIPKKFHIAILVKLVYSIAT